MPQRCFNPSTPGKAWSHVLGFLRTALRYRLPWLSQLEWVSAFCNLSRANVSFGCFLRSIRWLAFLVFTWPEFLTQVPPDYSKHPFKYGTVFCLLRWVKKSMPSSISEFDQCFSVWLSFLCWPPSFPHPLCSWFWKCLPTSSKSVRQRIDNFSITVYIYIL